MLGNILSLLCHSFTNCGEGKPEANTHNDIQLKELKNVNKLGYKNKRI